MWLITFIGVFSVAPLKTEDGIRAITRKVAADGEFRKRPDWEAEVQRFVEVVSIAWERQLGIRWKVVDFAQWAPPLSDNFLNSSKLFGHLKSTISTTHAEVVLGIFENKCLDDFGRLSDFFGSTAWVVTGCRRQVGSRNTVEMVISYELAHLYGAFHVRPHIRSVMLGDGVDIFDPQTSRVIGLMRDRKFAKGVNTVLNIKAERRRLSARSIQKGT